MHALVFVDPGHFHAALTLRERHPLVHERITVYASEADGGRELTEFLTLIEAFNRRPERPTAWKTIVRVSDDPLAQALKEQAGDVAILAGRNDRKMGVARRLHDAGIHVLADKPWLTRPEALPDVRHLLSGGTRVMEMMTSRHASTATIANRLVGERDIFGEFSRGEGGPAINLVSVHHLEKVVNGAPLRRPPWYFDVGVQGDGIADIPTHLVDQAQRFVATHGVPVDHGLELLAARRWSTPVPRAIFARVTGLADFPDHLRAHVDGDVLAYASNAELSFRLGGIEAKLSTRWDLTEPPGGGDAHGATITGTDARVRLEQGRETGFRRRLWVEPRGSAARLEAALRRAIVAWQTQHPGLGIAAVSEGFELQIPAGPGTAHEAQFPLVLDEFLRTLHDTPWPDTRAAETLAKYELLSQALTVAA